MKKISISLKDYFKIINVKYSYYRVIPATSIRNYNSDTIATAIQTLYKRLNERISRENKIWNIEESAKVSFYIYIENGDVEFYFIIPTLAEELLKEKIGNVWPKASIEQVDTIPWFSNDTLKYELGYSKLDILSIDVNKRCNEPLNSILNVLEIMKEGDKLGIFYNFTPTSQQGWRKSYDRDIQKFKNNQILDKDKFNTDYILKMVVFVLGNILDTVMNTFTQFLGGKDKNIRSEVALSKDNKREPSKATRSKRDLNIINTQILTFSESEDEKRIKSNILSICESYKSVSEDNELSYKKLKSKSVYSYTDSRLSRVVTNRMSTDELQNLLELPGRELLLKHKQIYRIDTLQEQVPPPLRKGYMYLGKARFKNQFQDAYLPDDPIYGNLSVTLCGPEGSGKTSILIRKAYESWKNKKATIIIDFIKNNDVCRKLMELIPKEDLIKIDCGSHESLQGLGYNEIIANVDDPYSILEASSMQSEQDVCLIDSCNSEPLSGRMLKYFLSAANVVHLQQYKNMSNVIECLESYVKRKEYIDYVKTLNPMILEELTSEIQTLEELDEKDKDGNIVGTKHNIITFILDRIIKLKSNMRLKHMYSKNCKNNINFVEAINNKKVILIMMPQLKFSTPISRNVCATYFISKTWLAAQIRGSQSDNPEIVNIIIDELYQVPIAEHLIGETLEQSRKFGNRYLFSCHNFNQLKIAPILKSEGSYIFTRGCDESNIETFKQDLDPFTYEDIQNMEEWHTLNLIKYKNGYGKFITHLPEPIE